MQGKRLLSTRVGGQDDDSYINSWNENICWLGWVRYLANILAAYGLKYGRVYFVSWSRRSPGHQSSDLNVFGKSCQRPIESKQFLERNRGPNFDAPSLGGSHVGSLEMSYNPIGGKYTKKRNI